MKAIHNNALITIFTTIVVANLLKVKNESNSQQAFETYIIFASCGKSTKSKEWKQFTT